MAILKVKNWSSHQSYKDRKPPWIRFHKSLLDNYEFQSMSVNSRAILPMLWLLASEDDNPTSGLIRHSYKTVSFRLRISIEDVTNSIKECVLMGFLEEVTDSYRESYETVTPETETETETETEQRHKKVFFNKKGVNGYGKPKTGSEEGRRIADKIRREAGVAY